LNTPSKVPRGLAISYLVLSIFYILSFILIFGIISTTQDIPELINVLDLGITVMGLSIFVIAIIMAFQARSVLNEIWSQKKVVRTVSWFFTLIFNLFYIQYEINRTIENKEMEKRVGPWICLILFILIPIILF